jgi:hypothetical protein
MKSMYISTAAMMLVLVAGLTYGKESRLGPASDLEVQVVDNNCWADFFEDTEFDADDPHVRVMGPFQSATLEDISGRDWSNEFESLIVGPNATVFGYKEPDFSGQEIAFVPNQRISDLDELDMSDNIESLKIQCGQE